MPNAFSFRFRPVGTPIRDDTVIVCTARDALTGGYVVLKMALADHEDADELRAEAALLADLAHPNVVRMVDRFTQIEGLDPRGVVSGFAMAWVDGDDPVQACKGLDVEATLQALGGVFLGVDYLHRCGHLHLDIKPANVLLGERGPVLLDLGSSRPLDAGPGEAGGTLGYAAPEVLLGQAPAVASDIYGLGGLLYEALAGELPTGPERGEGLRQLVLDGAIVPLRLVRRDVPRALADVVASCLETHSGNRPASVREVVDALRQGGLPAPFMEAGQPPFVGRARELAAVEAVVDARTLRPTAVVGAPGAGRLRLVRRSLSLLQERGSRVHDLCDAGAETEGRLRRLLVTLGCDTNEWPKGAVRWLASRSSITDIIALGRLEDWPADQVERILQLAQALATSGARVIFVATKTPPGCRPVHVDIMQDEALDQLARFCGAVGAEAIEARRISGGHPGSLLAAAGAARLDRELPAELREALDRVCLLPTGVPAAVHALLGVSVVQTLTEQRLVRLDAKGTLFHFQGAVQGQIDPAFKAHIQRWLVTESPDDALWAAAVAFRVGDAEAGLRLMAGLDLLSDPRMGLLGEALNSSLAHSPDFAVQHLTWLSRMSRHTEVVERLAAQDEMSPIQLHLLGSAYLAQGQHAELIALARDRVARDAHDAVGWLCLATGLAAMGQEKEADQAWSHVPLSLPSFELEEIRLLHGVGLALQKTWAGKAVQGLDALLEDGLKHSADPRAKASLCGRLAALASNSGSPHEALAKLAIQRADAQGSRNWSSTARIGYGVQLMAEGRAREARQVFLDAEHLGHASPGAMMMIAANLAELELRQGRLPAVERYIRQLREEGERHQSDEARVRADVLAAGLALERRDAADALSLLMDLMPEKLSVDQRAMRALYLAEAQLLLGQPEDAAETLDTAGTIHDADILLRLRALKGRTFLALGRRELLEASQGLPAVPTPLERLTTGRTLLARAGEDIDPQTFAERRSTLAAAAKYLKGADAARAATLRERLLEGPGADLEGVVELIESVQDPSGFPAALARLVAESLGAYRVLIMMKIPGLGTQEAYRELSGQQAAGIASEVLGHINTPDDVWRSDNAFADPRMREVSATVRTFEIKSLVAVAIPYQDKAIGALYVDDLHRAGRFSDDDVRVLQRLAAAVGRIVGLIRMVSGARPRYGKFEVLGVHLNAQGPYRALQSTLDVVSEHAQANILITGPTGAGKTWFARRVAVEVLGLEGLEEVVLRRSDPQMLVSLLSGTRKGDFTGAINAEGAIQRAITHRRALFLDEVQNVGDDGQSILLPLLELPNRRFGGLTGSAHTLDQPLVVIMGTNVDVAHGAWREHFREDLWFRMAQNHAHLPPLAERGAEAVYTYLKEMLHEHGLPAPEQVFNVAALESLNRYSWPGNLRELHTFAGRAAHQYRTEGPLRVEQLVQCGIEEERPGSTSHHSGDVIKQQELQTVLDALRKCDWVQADAARALGMTRWRMRRFLVRRKLLDEVKSRRDAFKGR